MGSIKSILSSIARPMFTELKNLLYNPQYITNIKIERLEEELNTNNLKINQLATLLYIGDA